MEVKTNINLQELYEIDDYSWIQETINLLKEKKFNELDLDNLIEGNRSLPPLIFYDRLRVPAIFKGGCE